MNDERFIQLLNKAGDFDLKESKEIDGIILDNIYNTPAVPVRVKWKERLFSPVLLRPVFAALIVIVLFFSILKIRNMQYTRIDTQKLYDQIISQIQKINSEKDIEMALSIYSEDFFKQNNRNAVKENIKTLFREYVAIKYEPIKEKIIIRNNNALIENKIKYCAEAVDKDVKPISYHGKERIYLKRYRDKWKIVAWVYEEK